MKNLNGQYQWQNFWDGVLVIELRSERHGDSGGSSNAL
jgi:hypothetical protein